MKKKIQRILLWVGFVLLVFLFFVLLIEGLSAYPTMYDFIDMLVEGKAITFEVVSFVAVGFAIFFVGFYILTNLDERKGRIFMIASAVVLLIPMLVWFFTLILLIITYWNFFLLIIFIGGVMVVAVLYMRGSRAQVPSLRRNTKRKRGNCRRNWSVISTRNLARIDLRCCARLECGCRLHSVHDCGQ